VNDAFSPSNYPRHVGVPRSFESDDALTVAGPAGQIAHSDQVEHLARFERRLWQVGDHCWTLVGNGLSNQTFVRGPGGIVAIDTGESVEEMRSAIAELRAVASEPIVAVLYTHFHYVGGTRAVFDDAGRDVPVHGHAKIAHNRIRTTSEIGPAYGRGLVEQFGIVLPPAGEDGLLSVGLGRAFREERHAPHTYGFVAPTHTFDGPTVLDVAGLRVEVTPASSDADDSVTYWFPALRLAVQNAVWPALFNVFAIRGEEYRDPRVLLAGIDHLRSLGAEHLVGAHGPPLSGADDVARRATRSRDAIQFLWDQTVRWTNKGATSAELAHRVVLPDLYGDDYLTQQLYGLVEHHARQIRTGLFGFFDGDPQHLLPLEPRDRAQRMVAAMGGRDRVMQLASEADDLRWALELAGLLHASDPDDADGRRLLAGVLRTVARRTTAANIRNWCLTRALGLEGSLDLARFTQHRFSRRTLDAMPAADLVTVLRVLVDPDLLGARDVHVRVELDGVVAAGLHFRNAVACPTDGAGAEVVLRASRAAWSSVLVASTTLDAAVQAGEVAVDGEASRVRAALDALASLDHPGFARR